MRSVLLLALLGVGCDTPNDTPSSVALFAADEAAPPPVLEVTALIPGQPVTFTVAGLPPGAQAAFVGSFAGPGTGPCLFGGVTCVDLSPVFLVGIETADSSGVATRTVMVPNNLPVSQVYFQAALTFRGRGYAPPPVLRVVGDQDLDGFAGADDCDDNDPLVTGPCPTTCTSWLATYDLTGSSFFIDAIFDFNIVLQQPYTDPLNMGPGSVTVRFADVGGAPGPGPVAITQYDLTQNFSTGVAGFAVVTTALQNSAGPDACGLATGTYSGNLGAWSPPGLADVCQEGTISCTGFLCGSSGAPPAGAPTVIDQCADLDIQDFTFSADRSTFTSPGLIVSSTPDQTVTLTLQGTRVSLVEDPNTPLCACP